MNFAPHVWKYICLTLTSCDSVTTCYSCNALGSGHSQEAKLFQAADGTIRDHPYVVPCYQQGVKNGAPGDIGEESELVEGDVTAGR